MQDYCKSNQEVVFMKERFYYDLLFYCKKIYESGKVDNKELFCFIKDLVKQNDVSSLKEICNSVNQLPGVEQIEAFFKEILSEKELEDIQLRWELMKKLKEGWHVFGLLWEEDGYTFFIDGVQNGRKITEVVSHADTFVLIGTEPNGYRGYIPGHVKDNPHYKIVENDEFIVDYVRVFDKMK